MNGLAQVATRIRQRLLAELMKERKAIELRREEVFVYKEEPDTLETRWGWAYYGIHPLQLSEEEEP
jgi:hypothetical protein